MNIKKLLGLEGDLDKKIDNMQDMNEKAIGHLENEREERIKLNARLEQLRAQLGVISRDSRRVDIDGG